MSDNWLSTSAVLFASTLPLAVFLITLASGFVLRSLVLLRLARLAEKTHSKIDDIVIASIKAPFIIWSAMVGIYLALRFSELSPQFIGLSGKILLVLGILSVTITVSNIVSGIINSYSHKISSAMPVTSLTGMLSRIVIFGLGILIILNALGISITPILATLGVGGLAVALALQETLSNLFSGFHIVMARQIRVGDYVRLESGEEGYIVDINWRTTKVRMLPNNVTLVPNSKLAQSVIINYHLPEKEMAVLVNVGVHYDSDLEKVERVTCEVARDVMRDVQGGVKSFEPFIRYHTFADFSINFTVILRAGEFVDQYLIKHEFVKRLHKRYAKEGIVIPYPIRTIEHGTSPKDTAKN